MTEAELDPTIREWLFAREALRRLGFSADDLFFACQPAGKVIEGGVAMDLGQPVIMLVLKTQGKQFSWTVGIVDLPVDRIEPAYIAACELWNTSPDDGWRDTGFRNSLAFRHKVDLVATLKAKGFVFGDWIIN